MKLLRVPCGLSVCVLLVALMLLGSLMLVSAAPPGHSLLSLLPPQIVSPQNGAFFAKFTQIEVTGTASFGTVRVELVNNGSHTQTAYLDSETMTWRDIYGPLDPGYNRLMAIGYDATSNPSAPDLITITYSTVEPLYGASITPTAGKLGTVMTLTAYARGDRPEEGAPTVSVWATMPTVSSTVLSLTPIVSGTGILTSTWQTTWTIGTDALEGYLLVVVKARDEALEPLENSIALWIEIDRRPPEAPRINTPDEGQVLGSRTVRVAGSTEPWAQLVLTATNAGSTLVTTLDAGPDGQWQIDLTLTADGTWTLCAVARDAVGNTSGPSIVRTILVDTQPPQVTTAWAEPSIVKTGGGALNFYVRTQDATTSVTKVVADGLWPGVGIVALDYVPASDWWQGNYQISLEGEGPRMFTVTATDQAGNSGQRTASVTLDNTPPQGQVMINNGAQWTSQATVTLSLLATDNYTVTGMRLGNQTDQALGGQITYTPSLTWTLLDQIGLRWMYAQFVDEAGNLSSIYPASISLDNILPSLRYLWLEEDDAYAFVLGREVYYGHPAAGSGTFRVEVDGSDDLSGLASIVLPETVSAGGIYTSGPVTHIYTFTDQSQVEGQYAATVSDWADNILSVPFTVTRDITPPTAPTNLQVNGGTSWITTSNILVTWDASMDTQSGVATYIITTSDGAQIERYGTSYTLIWTGPDTAQASIGVRARDNVSNTSAPAIVTFGVDRTPPESQASAPAYANDAVTVTWTATAPIGIASVELWVRSPGGSWRASGLTASGTSGSFSYFPTGGDGTYYFATVATNGAGLPEATPSGVGDTSTVYDHTPPTNVSITATPNGAALALTWSANAAIAGLNHYDVDANIDGGEWQVVLSNTTATRINYAAPPGHRYTFRVTATDNAGNSASEQTTVAVNAPDHYFLYLPLLLRDLP